MTAKQARFFHIVNMDSDMKIYVFKHENDKMTFEGNIRPNTMQTINDQLEVEQKLRRRNARQEAQRLTAKMKPLLYLLIAQSVVMTGLITWIILN